MTGVACIHHDTKPGPAPVRNPVDWRRGVNPGKFGPSGTIPVGFSALIE